ncbi:MAG: hypothetical protein ACOYYS_27990 [Chloroflexota bacterium]
MNQSHSWQAWAQTLQHWGGSELVASLLEAAGPLTWLGAQVIYLGQPFFGSVLPRSDLSALAALLEDPQQVHAFAGYLRQSSRGARD